MGSVLYRYGKDLYVNLTNRCPCRCSFCIRSQQDGVGSAGSLWLEQEPTAQEVIYQLSQWNLADFEEVVFCGYGEPFCALDAMLAVCRHLRSVSGISIRVNTNGLGDLINQRETPPLLKGLVDTVSISLNAPDEARYCALCSPSFGIKSYSALLSFASRCKQEALQVTLTVVDILNQEEIAACQKTARELGLPLRIRHYGG